MSLMLSGHLCLGGDIISDPVRVLAYMRAGLAGPEFNAAFSEHTCTSPGDISCSACYCELLADGPYVDPVTDDAPWSDGSDAANEFLGFLANKISLNAPVKAALTPRSTVGSVLGPQTMEHRIISVEGVMVASSARGMNYGWRWLYDVTRGGGCGEDALTVLPACPDPIDPLDAYAELDETVFRHLYQVGLIDGPTPDSVVDKNCLLQGAAFQFAAGLPYLHTDAVVVRNGTLAPEAAFNDTVTTPMWRYESALTFTIKNTDASTGDSARDIRIKVHALADGETFDETYHNACVDIVIDELLPGETMVIDAVQERVQLLDPSAKTYTNGWNRIGYDGLFDWPVIGPCTSAGVSVWYDRASGAYVDVTVESTQREI